MAESGAVKNTKTGVGKNAKLPYEAPNCKAIEGDEAIALLIPRAEMGDIEAMYMLGVIYETGAGVPSNMSAAAAWFRKAVEQVLRATSHN